MAKDESKYDTDELYGGALFDDDNVSDEGSEGASASASSSPTPTPTLSSSDIESPQQDYYSYMADWNNVMPMESDEDYAKRRKRAKNAALFGAISDGLSSLANLWGTTRYGKSFYNADTPTMTGKVLERYDKMEDERKKDKAAWAQGAQRARQLDEAKKEKDRSWKLTLEQWAHQQKKDANQEKRAQAEEERKAALHPEQLRAAKAGADTAEHQATVAAAQAKYAEEKEQANLNNIKAQTAAHNRSNRGESSGGKVYANFLGKNYFSQADYEADVRRWAERLDIDDTWDRKTRNGMETRDDNGEVKESMSNQYKTEPTPKTIARLRAEIEAKIPTLTQEKYEELFGNSGSMLN